MSHQFETLRTIKDKIKDDEAYVILDFSQNYICKYKDEVQSAHFGGSKKQISLQTGGFYIKNCDKIVFKSCAAISECLTHDAAAAWALLQPVLQKLCELKPSVKRIHFQSDGPLTQYKNKTNFYLFHFFSNKFNLTRTTWNYTTAGHGKSSADGIGGNVKNMCDNAVSNGTDVHCAQDMIDVVKSKNSAINMFLVTESDIKLVNNLIPDDLSAIDKTMSVHQICWTKEISNQLNVRYLSCSKCIFKNYCCHLNLKKV